MFRVLVTETLDDACFAWLAERCDVQRVSHEDPGFVTSLADADALVVRTYTRVDQALLNAAPKLKVVGRAGVGLDNFDLNACRARGVRVVYTPDANTQAVVEYVTGLMLDHYRPRTALSPDNASRFHELRKTEVGTQLDRLTLGVLGFGRIGKRLGQVAHAIGMNLLVHDLIPEAELRPLVGYPFTFVDRDTLFADSDILSVHVDGRPENRSLLDAAAFARMKPDSLFINAARGFLVDHTALLAWLEANPQSHAVLDVHDPEPVPADHPLLTLDRCRLLPHLASRTGPALENMSWIVRDVWAVLNDEPPRDAAV